MSSTAVDVFSARREFTLTNDVIRSLPTVRSYNAVLGLVPGVVMNSNDVVTGTATSQFPIHGGRANEGRLMLDGLNIGSPPGGNTATSYVVDVGAAQEVTFVSTGGLGEAETGGVRHEHRSQGRWQRHARFDLRDRAEERGCSRTT